MDKPQVIHLDQARVLDGGFDLARDSDVILIGLDGKRIPFGAPFTELDDEREN